MNEKVMAYAFSFLLIFLLFIIMWHFKPLVRHEGGWLDDVGAAVLGKLLFGYFFLFFFFFFFF